MAKKTLSPEAKSAKNVGRAQGAVVALLAASIGAVVLNKAAKKNVVTIATNGLDKSVNFVKGKVKGKSKKAASSAN